MTFLLTLVCLGFAHLKYIQTWLLQLLGHGMDVSAMP